MASCMAYQYVLSSNQTISNLSGIMMINCIECKIPFYARHTGKACSLKCKILSNIVKIDNGCWLYKNSTSGAYGKVRWERQWFSAHRVSYEQFIGPIEKGKWVCHKCDVPKCVNPDHLFIGSASENRKDAVSKRRVMLGEKNHLSKFTDAQIKEMRKLKEDGFTYARLQRIFNCSMAHLFYVIKNRFRKET